MKKFGLFAVILALLACSCSSNAKVNSVLDRAENVMVEHPDSALYLLQSVRKGDIKRERTFARYALRYSQALDKNDIELWSDTLIRVAVDYYMRKGTMAERSEAIYYLGRVYQNAGKENKAADQFIQAEVLSRRIANKHPYMRGLICQALATCYYRQNGFGEAIRYYKESEAAYLKAGRYSNAGKAYCKRSCMYYYLYDYVNTIACMHRAIGCFEKIGDTNEIATAKQWLRVLESMRDGTGRKEMKQALLKKYGSDPSRVSVSELSCIAHFYAKENNLDSTRYFVKQILSRTHDSANYTWVWFKLSELEKAMGNHSEALGYLNKGVVRQRSIDSMRRISSVQTLERRIESEKLQYDYDALQTRSHFQTIIGVLIFLLALTLVWQLVRSSRQWRLRLLRQQRAAAKAQYDLAERMSGTYSELEKRHQALLEKTKAAASDELQKDHFCNALETRLTGLRNLVDNAYVYKAKPAAFFKAFSTFAMVSPSAKKEVWADLQYVVNKKFGGIVDHLRTNYPELNPRDLDLCCMICFGFTPAGICFIYGYEDMGSLYNKRSRLRQKLHLTEEVKLEEYLLRLCRELQPDDPQKRSKNTDSTN